MELKHTIHTSIGSGGNLLIELYGIETLPGALAAIARSVLLIELYGIETTFGYMILNL